MASVSVPTLTPEEERQNAEAIALAVSGGPRLSSSPNSGSSSSESANGLHLTILVVGKVTHSSARILVEVLEAGEMTCTLRLQQVNVRPVREKSNNDREEEGDEKTAAESERKENASLVSATSEYVQRKYLPAGRPTVFYFEGLYPNARYRIDISPLAHPMPKAGFRTLVQHWKVGQGHPPFKFGVVSCNLLSETRALREEQTDLWEEMKDRVERDEIDILLHVGDQVYSDEPRSMDDTAPPISASAPDAHAAVGKGSHPIQKSEQLAFRKCMAMLDGMKTPAEYLQLAAQMGEVYRTVYRETWSHPPTAHVLANTSNLTIFDDHDFLDNFGSIPEHHNKTGKVYAIGLVARQIYYEYQGCLSRDVDLLRVPSIIADHHFHVFGEYGVAFTESRGALTFRYDPDDTTPFLGRRQWADLEAALSPGGVFDACKHLIMVCPVPVVYLPRILNAMSEPICEDALGHWASKPFHAEQTRMLNLCLAWQEGANAGERMKTIQPPSKYHDVEDLNVKDDDGHINVDRYIYPQLVGKAAPSSGGETTPSPCTSDRVLSLVGGDVHVGGHTRLYRHGHLVLEQLVSSAIANHIIPNMAFVVGSTIQNAYTELDDGWAFRHQTFTRWRNYALLTVEEDDTPDENRGKGRKKPKCTRQIIWAE